MKAKAKKASRQKQPATTQPGQNVPRGTFVTHSPGQLKTEIANVRLPASLAVAARKRAAFWGETVSEYVRGLIIEDLRHARRL